MLTPEAIEAAAEAFAIAEGKISFSRLSKADQKYYRELMTEALTAATSFIKAEALREAAEEMTAKCEAIDYDHWRGIDYAEGKETAYEDACDYLRARAANMLD